MVQLKARFPFKPDDNIRGILTQKLDGKDPLLDEECHAITTYMYNDQDAAIILDAVSVLRCGSQCSGQLCVSFLWCRPSSLPRVCLGACALVAVLWPCDVCAVRIRPAVPVVARPVNVRLAVDVCDGVGVLGVWRCRDNSKASSADGVGIVLYSEFLKVLLDFQLHNHELFLEHFRAVFRTIDTDSNGVISDGTPLSSKRTPAAVAPRLPLDATPVRVWFCFVLFVLFVSPWLCVCSGVPAAGALDAPGDEADLLARADPFSNAHISFSDCVLVLSADLARLPATA